jgi:hypothetical protein
VAVPEQSLPEGPVEAPAEPEPGPPLTEGRGQDQGR